MIQLPRLFLGSVVRKPTARKDTTLFCLCQAELRRRACRVPPVEERNYMQFFRQRAKTRLK